MSTRQKPQQQWACKNEECLRIFGSCVDIADVLGKVWLHGCHASDWTKLTEPVAPLNSADGTSVANKGTGQWAWPMGSNAWFP
jgi:hypothetical protein